MALCLWSATVSSISAADDPGEVSVSEIRKSNCSLWYEPRRGN